MSKHTLCIAALCFALLAYSGIVPRFKTPQLVSLIPPESVSCVSGKLVSNPVKTSTGNYYRFTFAVHSVSQNASNFSIDSEARGQLIVLLPVRIFEALLPGKLYSASRGASVPLIEQGIPLTFFGSMSSAFFIADRAEYEQQPMHTMSLLERIAYFRGLCRLEFKRIMYAWHDAGGLFLALVSGSAEYTDPKVSNLFKLAGLAHILALSGMHLSIFSGFSSRMVKNAGKKIAGVLSFAFVVLFVWFAGTTPSLRRAFIGFTIGALSRLAGKRPNMTAQLALCFFIHVMIAPAELYAVSFILSYGGLAGILTFGTIFHRLLARIPHFPAVSGISASAGAFMATAPVSAIFWGYITPGSIIASTIVSPLATVFLIAGIICFLASLVMPALLFPLGGVMQILYRGVTIPTEIFAQIPPIGI